MIKAYVEPIFDNFMFEMLTLLPFGTCLDALCFSFCSWDDVFFFIIKTYVHQLPSCCSYLFCPSKIQIKMHKTTLISLDYYKQTVHFIQWLSFLLNSTRPDESI